MFIVRIVQNTKSTQWWGKWRLLALEHVAPSIELPVRYQMLLQMIQSVCSECLKSLALTRGLLCKHLQTLQLRDKCYVQLAWLWPGRLTVYPLTHSKISQCFSIVSCVAVHISTQHSNPRVNTSLSPSGIRLPSKRCLSLHHSAQTGARTHPAPHSMGTKSSASRNKGPGRT